MVANKTKQDINLYDMSRINWLHKLSSTALSVTISVKDRHCSTDLKPFILCNLNQQHEQSTHDEVIFF